jgi:hypothetical protein
MQKLIELLEKSTPLTTEEKLEIYEYYLAPKKITSQIKNASAKTNAFFST